MSRNDKRQKRTRQIITVTRKHFAIAEKCDTGKAAVLTTHKTEEEAKAAFRTECEWLATTLEGDDYITGRPDEWAVRVHRWGVNDPVYVLFMYEVWSQ